MVRTLMRSKLVGLMFGQTTKKRDSSKSHSVASTEAAVFCFASGGKLWPKCAQQQILEKCSKDSY